MRSHEVQSLLCLDVVLGSEDPEGQEMKEMRAPGLSGHQQSGTSDHLCSAPSTSDQRPAPGDLHGLLSRHHDQPPAPKEPEQPTHGRRLQDHRQASGNLLPSIHSRDCLLRDENTATKGESFHTHPTNEPLALFQEKKAGKDGYGAQELHATAELGQNMSS